MDALNYATLRNTMRRTTEMNRVRMLSLQRGVKRTRREISASKRPHAERQGQTAKTSGEDLTNVEGQHVTEKR